MSYRNHKSARPCSNPMFEKWLLEWRDLAASRNLKTKYVYEKAISSLRKYPLVLRSGKEAKLLEFFGDKICEMLDRKIAEHKTEIGTIERGIRNICCDAAYPDRTSSSLEPLVNLTQSSQSQRSPSKRKTVAPQNTGPKRQRQYIPSKRSGPYALLLTLYNCREDDDIPDFMRKTELMAVAQPLCDVSFTVPDAGSHHTAWSSMATLIKKGLISKEGNPPRFALTDDGAELVIKILDAESGESQEGSSRPPLVPRPSSPNSSDSRSSPFSVSQATTTSSQQSTASSWTATDHHKFSLKPRQFEIILVVDNCETASGGQNERKKAVQTELRRNGVCFDVRKLNVGDFIWIAREKVSPVPGQLELPAAREIALDFIVERKRKDDLSGSIIDGRFKEQKYRLKNCGLRRTIYLVEEYGPKNKQAIPETTLLQAVTNTQLIDGFTIKYTNDQTETVAYLTLMTRYLQSSFSNKILFGCTRAVRDNLESAPLSASEHHFLTFEEFNNNCAKNKPPTITELFAKQLFRTPGLSADKVHAIIEHFPTPSSLFKAYDQCSSQQHGENLLSGIKFGKSQRNLGPAVSKILYQLYNEETLR